MANLKTDYKDDILDSTQNLRRKFRMITNDDGTFSFEDVTDYLQYGDSFGALDLNAITNAIMNECLKRTDVVDNAESTATDLPASANIVRELKENMIKPPSTSTLISSNFTSGSRYEADEDCWVMAVCTTNATTYAILTMTEYVNQQYIDRICYCGVSNRSGNVKLYIKKGTKVQVTKEGAFGDISLYKLV